MRSGRLFQRPDRDAWVGSCRVRIQPARPRSWDTAQFSMTSGPLEYLTVVIPARDEMAVVAATVQHLHLELSLHRIRHEIVVVDDGSADGTWEELRRLAAKPPA